MRVILAATLLAVCLSAAAQSGARPRPAGTVALDEPVPPPPMVQADPALEAQVTMRTVDGQEVQEYRVAGKLVLQRVTPKHGKPYILVDHRADGSFSRHDNPLDNGVRVPQWVLMEF